MATKIPSKTKQRVPLLALEFSPLPMATVEGATQIVRYANPAFCTLIGRPPKQIFGKSLSELLPKDDKCVTLIDRVFKTGKAVAHTQLAASKPHSVFFSYTMWPLREEKLLVGVMIQVTETTEVHDTTVALNEALMIGSIRQHELAEAAENLNQRLLQEIEARRLAAQELAEKARLLDLSDDAIIVRDLEGRITYWNRGAEEMYGWTAEEVLGQVSHILFNTVSPETPEKMTQVLAQTGRWSGEMVHTRRDGRSITVLVRKALDRDPDGNPASVLQNITDITERKRTEAALLEAGNRFRFMAESMPQKIFTADANGEVNYLNRQWSEFTGISTESMNGQGWKQFIHPEDLEENVRLWQHSMETGEPFELEHRFRHKDGHFRWHLSRARAIRNEQGQVTLWIGSSTDIDDMIRAQEELLDAEAQLADRALQLERLVSRRTAELRVAHEQLLAEADQRKQLEAGIANSIENERERLGQELHDGIVQELTGITMMLHVLAKNLATSDPSLAAVAERLRLMLEETHGNARDLAKSFFPVELEQHGLLVALQGVAQRAEKQFGISCEVQADANAPVMLKDAVSVQLFRIAQEAVNNAGKHSRAQKIVIRLGKHCGQWLLTVRDDGVGMADAPPGSHSMGLSIMQHRARLIQAVLTVADAVKGGGVIVTCAVPAKDPS